MSLKIIKAGLLDTVQDLGRNGYQHLGINPGGAMDRFSASLANALLGKELTAPVIEMHLPAPTILFDQPCIICLSGGDFSATINDELLSLHQPYFINESNVLQFKKHKHGARSYLSLVSDIKLKPWLNSYSTNLKAVAGGFNGRALKKDDAVAFEAIEINPKQNILPLPWRYSESIAAGTNVEFMFGNEWAWLDHLSQTTLLNEAFVITPQSDRMGYRLKGPQLKQTVNDQLVSSAVSFGTMQLLPNGQVIVLMADHQTTGGYPRIGHVASTSLSTLAQLKASDAIKFAMTTIDSAEEKLLTQQQHLTRLQNTCKLKMQNWLHAHRH
jgi:antagonist of KipI